MASFALKFISGKYQGGEFLLDPGREIVVGRAQDLDMVLVEDMVSRKHAKISTASGQIIIQDLGSTNGTFVNGEKIKKTRLKQGDRILIGTSILKMVETTTAAPAQRISGEPEASSTGGSSGGDMTGMLDEVPVPDLLQLFGTSKRTGVLMVSSGGNRGEVFLREGTVFYALVNDDHDLGPMKSLCRVMSWDEGTFEFAPNEGGQSFMMELDDSTEALVAAAQRQNNEFSRLEGDLPPMQSNLRIPQYLEPPLSLLGPAELDVLQLAINHGQTQSILDKSATTDAETATVLLSLISQNYLERG